MAIVRTPFNDNNLWSKIEQANESINTISLKRKKKNEDGSISFVEKDYAEVNQRVKAFRFVYTRGKIETKIISLDGELGKRVVLMRCEVYDDLGNLLSVGYAEEKENASFINQTSFIENCETSCVGRALGLAGFGIDVAIASYEEVRNATSEQKKPTLLKISNYHKVYSDEERKLIREHYQVEKDEDLPREVVDKYIAQRKDKLKEIDEEIEKTLQSKPLKDSEENPFY